MIVSIIFTVFFGGALFWAAFALYVQGRKLVRIWNQGINGHERLMSVTYVLVCFMNAYFMHIILLAFISNSSSNSSSVIDYSMIEIYILVSLLLGTVGSGVVSSLILSKRTFELIAAIKKFDTDGHRFKDELQDKIFLLEDLVRRQEEELQNNDTMQDLQLNKIRMLGIWPDSGALDLKTDFLNVLRAVGNLQLHSLISDSLTLEKIVADASGEFDIIYLATHSTGIEIDLGNEHIDITTFAAFAQSKKAKLVILGVCEGRFLANLLLDKGIETVVYWLNPVEDEHAIKFVRIFFTSLSEGKTVQGAVDNAKLLLPQWVGEGSLRVDGHKLLCFLPFDSDAKGLADETPKIFKIRFKA
jgi:hypothetical protein